MSLGRKRNDCPGLSSSPGEQSLDLRLMGQVFTHPRLDRVADRQARKTAVLVVVTPASPAHLPGANLRRGHDVSLALSRAHRQAVLAWGGTFARARPDDR